MAPQADLDSQKRSRRRKRLKNLRRAGRYYAALPMILILSRLPLWAARVLGYGCGTLGWLVARTNRLRAMENLTASFGQEKSPRELRRICRNVFRNTVTNVLEVLVVQRWSKEKIRRFFPLSDDFNIIYAKTNSGAVGITAHFGNWELLGVLHAAYLPGHLIPVAKRIYFEKYQKLVERFRTRVGLEVVYTDESPRRILNVIRSGKFLGILPDQDLKVVNGVFVDFFGRPAYTSTMPAHLAMATRPDLKACFLVRKGRRYQILWHDIPLARTGQRMEDLQENTRRWTNVLEQDIRSHIDQWVWFHRRWRTRPEDGPLKVVKKHHRHAPAAE